MLFSLLKRLRDKFGFKTNLKGIHGIAIIETEENLTDEEIENINKFLPKLFSGEIKTISLEEHLIKQFLRKLLITQLQRRLDNVGQKEKNIQTEKSN